MESQHHLIIFGRPKQFLALSPDPMDKEQARLQALMLVSDPQP
jgi:hypothetical protein